MKGLFLAERFRKLRGRLETLQLEGYLSLKPSNIHYFTGSLLAGELSFGLLVSVEGPSTLFIPKMAAHQVSKELQVNLEVEVSDVGEEPLSRLREALKFYRVLGFDDAQHSKLSKLKVGGVKFRAHPELPEELRMVKDSWELKALRRAANILGKGFEAVSQVLRPGVQEWEVALEAEQALRRGGSEFYAFPTLVASGRRSAYPHGRPSKRKIRRGDVVVVDLGAKIAGYCADATRTFLVGEVKPSILRACEAVLEAYRAAVEGIKPGMRGFEADRLAREALKARSLAKYFTHGLGHGVGLEVHEAPRLSPRSRELLREGSTFTLEPAVYLPGRFGVRLENTVLLKGGKIEALTRLYEKEFIKVG